MLRTACNITIGATSLRAAGAGGGPRGGRAQRGLQPAPAPVPAPLPVPARRQPSAARRPPPISALPLARPCLPQPAPMPSPAPAARRPPPAARAPPPAPAARAVPHSPLPRLHPSHRWLRARAIGDAAGSRGRARRPRARSKGPKAGGAARTAALDGHVWEAARASARERRTKETCAGHAEWTL